ncbi:MAG: hypothetical protein JAY99_15245 [Candidatus Thiodiazotropha lotti]|nr:hypothetical protein [Candidatus Thiodiazotropha weberae]MCG7993676.1 hypothetical protein [Candidatus Thiodiazotropha lotti]MCG8000874.1 hypothetical protein [Candidatus Thiodiazotropha lotti]MCW4185341.1 hypothetical protein [Candidatus Thiodiazotropha weberae]MCW4192647.1 hypothetical protein [Candidatus Thiodiazotropha weberae]
MSQIVIKDWSLHSPSYQRHRPEQTLIYQIVVRHKPQFRGVMVDGMRHYRQLLLDGNMQPTSSHLVLGKHC